ncbi:MAG: glycosyltransferase family 2 protein [Phycisphaerales bacterium]
MKLSIIIPCLNEEANLRTLHERLTRVASAASEDHELIFVDDGSRDRTLGLLRELAASNPRVRYVSFSRNFGHEVAVAAGLDRATGDAAVLIDADLQDPPELIEQMVARWREGVHVVYAQRARRRGDPLAKRVAIYFFYRLLGRISEIDIPLDTGNFRLMDRRIVEIVRSCKENPRYVRGLVPWAGFRQEPLLFDRQPRNAGKTGYGFFRLVRLAFDGICSFSMVPLRLSTWLGAAVIALAIALTIYVIVERLFFYVPGEGPLGVPRGFAFLACVILFLGGVQLFMLGMLATYVGYIFKNVQNRPMYVVAEEGGVHDTRAPAPEVVVRPSAEFHRT